VLNIPDNLMDLDEVGASQPGFPSIWNPGSAATSPRNFPLSAEHAPVVSVEPAPEPVEVQPPVGEDQMIWTAG